MVCHGNILRIALPLVLLFWSAPLAAQDFESWPALAEYTVDSNFNRIDTYSRIKMASSCTSGIAFSKHAQVKLEIVSIEDLRELLRFHALVPSPTKVQVACWEYDSEADASYKLGFYIHGQQIVAQNSRSEKFLYADPFVRFASNRWLTVRLEEILPITGLGCDFTMNTYTVNNEADRASAKLHGFLDNPNITIIDGPCGSSDHEKDALQRLLEIGPEAAARIQTPTEK